MANSDGLVEAVNNYKKNLVEDFEGGYFSFAFGNEIALVLKGDDDYYILNCNEKLWEEVRKKVREKIGTENLKKFWFEKSKEYDISGWSGNFDNLLIIKKGEI